MTEQEQEKFSRKFSLDDWVTLCRKQEFLDALKTKTEPVCAVVAMKILNPPRYLGHDPLCCCDECMCGNGINDYQ